MSRSWIHDYGEGKGKQDRTLKGRQISNELYSSFCPPSTLFSASLPSFNMEVLNMFVISEEAANMKESA